MKKTLSILLIAISVILLVTSLFFLIGFSLDVGLLNPASIVMPIILTVVTGVGAVLLLIASIRWRKNEPSKKCFIMAGSFYALAVILIPITKAINQQMVINLFF